MGLLCRITTLLWFCSGACKVLVAVEPSRWAMGLLQTLPRVGREANLWVRCSGMVAYKAMTLSGIAQFGPMVRLYGLYDSQSEPIMSHETCLGTFLPPNTFRDSRIALTQTRLTAKHDLGGTSFSASYRWNFDPISRLAVAVLVLIDISCLLHDPSSCNFPRDWSECRRQWLNSASRLEHVSS